MTPQSNNSVTSRVMRNTMFLYIKTILSAGIILYSTRIVIQALGDSDYGVYGVVGGAIAMLGYLNIAMAQATQRFMNYAEGENDEGRTLSIFNNTVLLHIGLGAVIILIMAIMYYPLFHGILNIAADRIFAAKWIYLFLAISTFFTIITVPYDALINAHEDFLYYSIVGVIDALMKLGVAFIALLNNQDHLIVYGLLMALETMIMMIIMRLYCKKLYRECSFHPMSYANFNTIKELGSFAGWNFIGVFSSIAGNFGSTILMNHFFGTIVITAKNIGDQMCGQLNVLTNNMTKALNPSIVKSEGQGNRQQMLNLSLKGCKYGYLLYTLFGIPFMVEMPWILKIWLGKIPLWAVLFCQLQVLRTMLEQLTNPLKTSLMAEGSIKQINLIDLILSIVTFFSLFTIYYLGGEPYQHYTVSIIVLVIIESIIKIYMCSKKCKLNIQKYIRQVIYPSTASTLFSIATIYVLKLYTNILEFEFLCISVVASAIYIYTLGLSSNDRVYIVNIIKSKIKK